MQKVAKINSLISTFSLSKSRMVESRTSFENTQDKMYLGNFRIAFVFNDEMFTVRNTSISGIISVAFDHLCSKIIKLPKI